MTDYKKYNVIISKRAGSMLQSHARFLAQVSEQAANDFIAEFQESVQSLEVMPKRNPYLNDMTLPQNKYHKLVIKKRYLVIYQIKQDIVYVDYVVDCRQDYSWLL